VLNFNKKLELVDWLLKFHLKRFLGVQTGIQSVRKCSCQLTDDCAWSLGQSGKNHLCWSFWM